MVDEYLQIGLKGFGQRTKGMSFLRKIRKLIDELNVAWHRAYNGFSYIEVYNIDTSMQSYLLVLLQEYKEHYNSLWRYPEEYLNELCVVNGIIDKRELCDLLDMKCNYDELCDCFFLTKEQADQVIDTIIWHLRMSDEDFVEKFLYGTNCYDDNYNYKSKKLDDYRRIEDIRKQNQDAALSLLKIFWDELWI